MAAPAPPPVDTNKVHAEEELHEDAARPHLGARFSDGKSLSEYTTNLSEKNGSSRYANSTIGLDLNGEARRSEKKLVAKLDRLILPLAFLLYLFANLDRGNLGNAKLQGLYKNLLDSDPTKYSIALCCFFITYIVFNIPGILAAKRLPPSRTIAAGAFLWSLAASLQAATTSPGGLYACRLFVGIGEAMFGNAIAFYLSLWYKQSELSKRIGLYIGAGSLAGAFGGLIAYGVAKIKAPAIEPWRILFLIDATPCLLLSIIVAICLPNRPDRTRYLNADEQVLATTRLNAENGSNKSLAIDWKAVRYALFDWRFLLLSTCYTCMNLSLASVSGFVPTIIKGLGYSDANAQLYTVPPYACGLAVMMITTTLSDRFKTRGIFVVAVFGISVVGWAMLMAIDPVGITKGGLRARYFAICCVVGTGASNGPIMMAWLSANSPSESQRATGFGMLNSIGQGRSDHSVGAIGASFAFPSTEGPRFVRGSAVNMAFAVGGMVLAATLSIYYRIENRRRDEHEGGRPAPGMPIEDLDTLYDRAPGFRYTA